VHGGKRGGAIESREGAKSCAKVVGVGGTVRNGTAGIKEGDTRRSRKVMGLLSHKGKRA